MIIQKIKNLPGYIIFMVGLMLCLTGNQIIKSPESLAEQMFGASLGTIGLILIIGLLFKK